MNSMISIKSISQVHEFFGLPRPKHPLVSVLRIGDKVADVDFGDHIYVIDLYQVSLKVGHISHITYGRTSYDFEEGMMMFTKPTQTLKFENVQGTQNNAGWTLVFHPDLLRKSELGKIIEQYTFFSYDVREALHISDEEKETLNNIIFKIEKEYNQNIDRHSQDLIVSNIELLLKYSSRFYDRQFYTRTNLNKDVVTQFEEILSNYYNSELQIDNGIPTVKYCAGQIHKSPNYLSDLLKKETGRSALDHIHFHIIEKAKNMLLGSEDTVSEIAFHLGFEYPQYFGKLFKSKTGKSPTDYRLAN